MDGFWIDLSGDRTMETQCITNPTELKEPQQVCIAFIFVYVPYRPTSMAYTGCNILHVLHVVIVCILDKPTPRVMQFSRANMGRCS